MCSPLSRTSMKSWPSGKSWFQSLMAHCELVERILPFVHREVRDVVPREQVYLSRILCSELTQPVRWNRLEVPVELTVSDLVNRLLRRDADLHIDAVQVTVGRVRRPLTE